ncbi:hypothetical protein AYJ66_17570 [Dietzia cinnamea]|nr:hypothetical protein AYJ66_17570 [Dietzia cinnamea]
MAGCKTDARDIDFADFIHQVTQTIFHISQVFSIRVYILAKKGNFLVALCRKLADFLDDIFRTAASFFSSGIRNHAVCAELVAAVHNVYPCLNIAFAHFRKVFNYVPFLRPYFYDHFFGHVCFLEDMWQAMDIMGTKNHINLIIRF